MNLKEYGPEDWVTLVFFWVLAIVVFLQFFTRYALNDSLAWTEEIARYLLTCVAFLGGGMAVRQFSHIHVEFLYLYYPRGLAHFLSTLVDLIRVVFFGYATWLCWKVTQIMQTQPMVVVDWPMSIVYGICTAGLCRDDLPRDPGGGRELADRIQRPHPGAGGGTASMSTLALIGGFLLFMAIGVPVAISLAGASLIYVMIEGVQPHLVVLHRMIGGTDSFPLLAIPFFIMAGSLMNSGGITTRIYDFALALVGWMKGGLGHVNVVGSVIFAGMSGTAVADAGGLGNIEIRAMKDHGYDRGLRRGHHRRLFHHRADHSPVPSHGDLRGHGQHLRGKAVCSRFYPGSGHGRTMMIMVSWYAHTRGFHRDARFSLEGSLGTFKKAFLPLMTPVLLIGGMTTGVFTPTEAAIAATVYAMILGMFVYRTLSLRLHQGQHGNGRDHGHHPPDRGRRLDLRLFDHDHENNR